jgi:hypothetical protein
MVVGADAERPCRSSRDCLRPDGQESHHHRQRRRALRDLRRDEDLAAFHEPAALAVLSHQHRQRETLLQRLRRHAGQRLDLRAVTDAQRPCRHPHERLVRRRWRRWILHGERPRGSQHRLRGVAGGKLQPPGLADWRAYANPPAAPAVARARGATRRGGNRRPARRPRDRRRPGPRRPGRCGRAGPWGPWRRWPLALGYADRHQPALGSAHLRRRRPRLSQRRSWRQLGHDQPRPHESPRSGRDSHHGESLAAQFGGVQSSDDAAERSRPWTNRRSLPI